MARLFDISSEFASLFDRLDDIQDMTFDEDVTDPEKLREDLIQAWYDTLEGIESEFEIKAESVAQYIKGLKAEETAIKAEEDKLKKRRQQCEHRAECMTVYLKNCMEQMHVKKIETPKAKITIRNNAPALRISNETDFIAMLQNSGRDELLKYEQPKICKTEIKKLIKSGEIFDGATLESSQSVVIG
jgi:hypothetical protein